MVDSLKQTTKGFHSYHHLAYIEPKSNGINKSANAELQ